MPVPNPADALESYLFGPVSTTYCLWFYIISVFAFINLLIHAIGFVISILAKKIHWAWPWAHFVLMMIWFMGYFLTRLMYNMCLRSENNK